MENPGDNHLPAELDFFKYTQDTGRKRKSQSDDLGGRKKRRKEEDNSEVEDEDHNDVCPGEEGGGQLVTQRHRVKTKGSNVPTHFETFEELRTRYSVPSHITSSLEKYGYASPTSIQSYAIPILLEVC